MQNVPVHFLESRNGEIVRKDRVIFYLYFKRTLTKISLDFFHNKNPLICYFQPTIVCIIGNRMRVFLASQFTRKPQFTGYENRLFHAAIRFFLLECSCT